MTEAAISAMNILRSTEQADWTIIPLLFITGYVYAVEIERKDWDKVLLGVAAMGAWFLVEVFNSLVLHFSGYSALWLSSVNTNFLILAGFNIEIFVAYLGVGTILYLKILPEDRKAKVLGMPNRIVYPIGAGLVCFFIELLMNRFNLLIWDYSWWKFLVLPNYIGLMFFNTGMYDRFRLKLSMKVKALIVCGLLVLDAFVFILFGVILKWI